jgi:GNAT superfamily N-acetyltransferase
MDSDILMRPATLAEIVSLRHTILRAGLPRETALFPGDDAPTSRHYGAFAQSGRIIGCATLHLNHWDSEPAWQLRGMATDADHQRRGLGRTILNWLEADLLADVRAPRLMWCNARVPAAPFYERLGWRIVSEQFDIPTAGPHVRMVKRI